MKLSNKSGINSLSIIIVNYRSEKYLQKCLASIYQNCKGDQFEIIVVNNDSETDLHKIQEAYREIKLLNPAKNVGFGVACNLGAKTAKGDILLFLNPDTQFLNDYAGHIISKFKEAEDKIGVIGPRLITDLGETQAWCTGKDLTLKQRVKNKFCITDSKGIWESKKDVFTDWVSGAALAIKKELFEKLEGFDEKIFMYDEDLDLCVRARDLDYTVLYCPQRDVLHSGGKSCEGLFKQKVQHFKSTVYYIKKRIRRR